jgi:PAS domain S-box-containing protein
MFMASPPWDRVRLFLQSGPLKVALVYLVIGLAWIFFSDNIAYAITGGSDAFLLYSELKGFGFIIVTTLLLYGLIRYFTGASEKQQLLLSGYETRYRKLYESMMDGFAIVDMAGRIKEYNPAFREMLGYSDEELLDFSYHDITPDKWYESEEKILKEQVLPLGHSEVYEKEYRRKDGTIFPVELRAFILRDDSGQPVGMGAVVRDITGRKMAEGALNRATKKLGLLNSITFSDIRNAIFSLSGYLELEKTGAPAPDENREQYLEKEVGIIRTITESLKFANAYQNLGVKPPAWQEVNQTFLFGISHLNISHISRKLDIGGLEIFADPLLENVFFTLAENVLLHGKTATGISLRYQESPEGLVLFFEDNGGGIPPGMKEKIFEKRYEVGKGMGLFLAREILSVTGITIRETGEPGKGARFEMTVPGGGYRFEKKP